MADLDLPAWDDTHRYLPGKLCTVDGAAFVTGSDAYPPGQHPAECPIIPDLTAVRARLENGRVRWFGCQRAYIAPTLRMVLVGHPPRDEVRRTWRTVPKADRA